MAEHSHPALALTAIEVADVQPDPEQLNQAVVRFADGCATWLAYRTATAAERALDRQDGDRFDGAYVTRQHVVRLDVPGHRRLVFDPDTGARIPSYLDCPDHRPKARV